MKNPVHKVRVPLQVVELIRGLHPQLKRKVRTSLLSILKDPRTGKPLKGELEGLWSIRVSRFRLIYRISSKREVEIVALGPRERIYEETLRLVKKKQDI